MRLRQPQTGDQRRRVVGQIGHAIQLRRLRWNEPLNGCHIIFIGSSETEHLPAILKSVSGDAVLTVSDIDRFSLSGGMIEFLMVGNRVRFDINRTASQAARLDLSAKLLSVARAVHVGNTGQGN